MSRVKIITYVPSSHADKVRETFGQAGAGTIGEYTYCSFSSVGQGRSLPSNQTTPFYGQKGELSVEQEERIEVVCERSMAQKAIAGMKSVHPYDEVAYEVIALVDEDEL